MIFLAFSLLISRIYVSGIQQKPELEALERDLLSGSKCIISCQVMI